MSIAIEVQDQHLWNSYKTFAENSKGEGDGGELDDWFDDEETEGEDSEEDDEDSSGSSKPPEDEDDEDSDDGDEEGDDDAPSAGSKNDEESDDEPEKPNRSDEPGEDDEPIEDEDGEGDEPADQGSDNAGETGEVEMSLPEFDEALAQKISEDAKACAKDADYIIYSRDFDVIEPLKIDTGEDARKNKRWQDSYLTQLEDETRGMVGVMQKDIDRMMASRSQVMRIPGFRTGKLHSSALHRVVAGDDRVFRRKHENKSKDTAVSLLCDNSGSMHGQKMKVAMTGAYALSSTLERVQIKHEVLGFTTKYDNKVMKEAQEEAKRVGVKYSRISPIYMPIYKGFDERMGPEIKTRFAGAPYQHFMNANADSESLEYALARLLKRPEKRKVLMVFSDGQPAADGDMYQQIAHLHRVIETGTKMGVEIIGIGILSDAPKHFYPKHFILNKVEQLPGLVMNELKRILSA
ncbi:VWA domain-containing protein [Methylobacterium sp. AMS5]|uniref:cobaltochelatase CobT-related protein n=1 Tax=Methylobacterium sp. AMS5 TaxID=925818 RepID=UPI00074FA8E9|nr:VWA domain-containing protein [Methylobacterium sp. AMS5]AMB48381.1 hypothetical protein Y590_25770 [Methylobacterium sp. AMS5]